MKKKGFIGDFAFYFIYLFVISIVIVVLYMAYSHFDAGWQNSTGIPDSSKELSAASKTRFLITWNALVALLVIGLFIGIVVLAFVLRSHPAFAMIAILVIIVLGGVGMYLANSFHGFASSSGVSSYVEEFSLLPFIMNRLPYIVIGLGFIFIIVLYAKNSNSAI